jgi:hypothetical protein
MMPAGSVGMVLSPTYPMLRDAVQPLFLGMARHAGILRRYFKGDRTALLAGSRTVLFRTASDPDALRGPNLGWFWLDEAPLMDPEIWPIMLGRRRLPPMRGWLTNTPRGRLNWTHSTFEAGGDDYRTIVSSTRDAFWNPPAFLASMLANYSHDFARQEIDAEVLDDAQEGLLPPWWLDLMETTVRPRGPGGRRRMGVDLGYGTGKDAYTHFLRDDLGILHGHSCPYVGVPEAAGIVARESSRWQVRQEDIAYDAGGPGRDMGRYLQAHGITEAVPYFGSGQGGPKAVNRRSKCAWRMRERIDPQRPEFTEAADARRGAHPLFMLPSSSGGVAAPQPPFCLPADRPWWPQLRKQLGELRYSMVARRVKLEDKDELMKRLKRSPDEADALITSFSVDN